MNNIHMLTILLLLSILQGCSEEVRKDVDERPNILLIVLDDVGFNDLGYTGSEIATPTLDALAESGVFLTEFHVAPNCSPTRAMLLSGVDNHLAGLGNMFEELAPNQRGKPGYEGHLNFSVAALPEVLKGAGYRTYMTGKWHLGLTEETSPAARGFDKSFAMLQGGAGAFENMLSIVGPDKAKYRENGVLLDSLPAGFYSTEFYTKQLIDYIDADQNSGSPFFAYLAYTSPHWPLQAPASSIMKYERAYTDGYEKLKQRRLARLQAKGLMDPVKAAFSYPGVMAWDGLTEHQKKIEMKKMAVYAAMIDDVDRYLGELVAYLKEVGEFDNTFIFVLSDNGPESHDLVIGWDALAEWVKVCCDNSYENIGNADSYVWYGKTWGQAGNTPSRLYKGYTAQGGVRAPAFASHPTLIKGNSRSDSVISVMDVMPTLLEVAGVDEPGNEFGGRLVRTIEGKSLLPMLTGSEDTPHAVDYTIGWELFGKRALRQGDWKIIYRPEHELYETTPSGIENDRWQLYNLSEDPAELNDLSGEYPSKLEELRSAWVDYAERNNVLLPNVMSGY